MGSIAFLQARERVDTSFYIHSVWTSKIFTPRTATSALHLALIPSAAVDRSTFNTTQHKKHGRCSDGRQSDRVSYHGNLSYDSDWLVCTLLVISLFELVVNEPR